jgi:glycosyltransferase involved in cell wall biosynthesis
MVSLCEGAAALGVESEIISMQVRLHSAEPEYPVFRDLYLLDYSVRNTALPIPWISANDGGIFSGFLRLGAYSVYATKLLAGSRQSEEKLLVLSARNYSVLMMLAMYAKLNKSRWIVLADVHGPCKTAFQRLIHRMVDGNICITKRLADHLIGQCKISPEHVRVAHSGVKPERFALNVSKAEAVNRIGVNNDRPIICYTGKVYYRYQEVAYLIEVARLLANEATILIVGGRPDQILSWRAECEKQGIGNVIFTGFKIPSEIPIYLRAADLLVLYYSPSPLNDYRSPGKLFEYLASGTPLVSSRFGGIEEVVKDGENGFLVEPYRPDLLAARIRSLLRERPNWEKVSKSAIETAQKYAWKARASVFLEYANQLNKSRLTAKESD